MKVKEALRKTKALDTKPSDMEYYIVPLSTQKDLCLLQITLEIRAIKLSVK